MDNNNIDVKNWQAMKWQAVKDGNSIRMGQRVDPRPMQFIHNELDEELVIVETDRYGSQVTHRVKLEWELAKELLEEWI